jgi:8-oxo-dGTP pyrophosphatase MutT (NUDIX family)
MIFRNKPHDFNSKFNVVGCFCEYNGKLLLLLRSINKPQGNMWGLPSGKVENNENLHVSIQREVLEETGIRANIDDFQYLGSSFVRFPEYDFIYHLFKLKLKEAEKIKINPSEHNDFQWLTPQEATNLKNGMEDLDNCIKLYYSFS